MILNAPLDSGVSASLIAKKHTKKLCTKKMTQEWWKTAAGAFSTDASCGLDFESEEMSNTAVIQSQFHMHSGELGSCDMTMGRDLMALMGPDACFSNQTVKWLTQNGEVPMKP